MFLNSLVHNTCADKTAGTPSGAAACSIGFLFFFIFLFVLLCKFFKSLVHNTCADKQLERLQALQLVGLEISVDFFNFFFVFYAKFLTYFK